MVVLIFSVGAWVGCDVAEQVASNVKNQAVQEGKRAAAEQAGLQCPDAGAEAKAKIETQTKEIAELKAKIVQLEKK